MTLGSVPVNAAVPTAGRFRPILVIACTRASHLTEHPVPSIRPGSFPLRHHVHGRHSLAANRPGYLWTQLHHLRVHVMESAPGTQTLFSRTSRSWDMPHRARSRRSHSRQSFQDNSHSDLMSTGLTCLRKNAQASSGHGSTASGYTSSRHGSGLQDHFYRTLRTLWPWTGIPVVARPNHSTINHIADPPTLLTPSTPTHSDPMST